MASHNHEAALAAIWHDAASADQGSPAWHEARLGCVTASRIADVVARTKSGYGAARQTYMRQLLAERLTGMASEVYINAAMRWGTDMEPHAVAAYEEASGVVTELVGFLSHPAIAYAGASPDRLVGHEGLLEVKCPASTTHIDTLLSGEVPERYMLQMQWQMACSGRAWCDFVSFDPRLPQAYASFITRVSRDDKCIARLEDETRAFLEEIEQRLDELEVRSGALARLPFADAAPAA
ncbi:MAG: YqaJ viral recombinase family protein [Erythrobacteraceae bacterium]|nr:YqaJ viral recombinase family protein [Erythrobacteraceae bacterium]